MTTVQEVRDFLSGVDEQAEVFIDEGGLCLCIREDQQQPETVEVNWSFEVGGDPRLDEEADQ